jgi:hypothetical protein
MGFDQSAFIIAGTAIAIAGVGLYIWDTRGKELLSGSSQAAPQYNYNRSDSSFGGARSRNRRKSSNSKTKRH